MTTPSLHLQQETHRPEQEASRTPGLCNSVCESVCVCVCVCVCATCSSSVVGGVYTCVFNWSCPIWFINPVCPWLFSRSLNHRPGCTAAFNHLDPVLAE